MLINEVLQLARLLVHDQFFHLAKLQLNRADMSILAVLCLAGDDLRERRL